MARLPTPGSDQNIWGNILNEYLRQSLADDGSLKDGIVTAPKMSPDIQAVLAAAMSQVVLDKQWAITGPINVAALEVDYIAPAYVSLPAGTTAAITQVRARINSGISATLQITKNSAVMAGLGSVVVTASGVSITGLDIPLGDGDLIAPVVTSTSGSPQNMTLQVVYRVSR